MSEKTDDEKAAEEWAESWWNYNLSTLDANDGNRLRNHQWAAEQGFRAGVEYARPKWVSVKERLPEVELMDPPRKLWQSFEVLVAPKKSVAEDLYVCFLTRRVIADKSTDEYTWHEYGSGKLETFEFEAITHWMPLPKPPEDK